MKHASKLFAFAISAALALSLTTDARAASSQQVMLDCYVGQHTNLDWAGLEQLEETDDTTVNRPPIGFQFDDSLADEEVQCVWIVPSDYDTSATGEPSLFLVGWSVDHVPCLVGCSTAKRYVELEVSMKAYHHNELVDNDFGVVDNATFTWDSESCATDNCFREDKLKEAWVDITDDAANLATEDLVYIRIKRDVDISNDLPVDFFLAGVRLTYESTQD